MLKSDDLDFFAAVAGAPSLAAAARHLGVSAPAVTQRLQELERRVGVRLVHRTGRTLSLTEEGLLLADGAGSIVSALGELTDRIQARRGIVTGRLRVVAPMGFGRTHIAPLVATFAAAHPAVQVELRLSDRLGTIPEGTWDIAVHIGELRDSSLVAHRLAPNERICCAAPSLLAEHGTPASPADLSRWPCIAIRENDEDTTLWRFVEADGLASVRIDPVLATNDGEVAREWAVAGRGVVVRSEWSVAGDVAAGRLVRILPTTPPPPANVMALVASRTGHSARTTAFMAALRRTFAAVPWREGSEGELE
jgi:DNA-binding transcriptional LysR family regulator